MLAYDVLSEKESDDMMHTLEYKNVNIVKQPIKVF